MAEGLRCAKCGGALTGAEHPICPCCLAKVGFGAAEREGSDFGAEPWLVEGGVSRQFGDYELLEEIARGGMGIIYKARQTSLGRIVAVKMILGGALADRQFIDRFRTEAAAAAILQHPNIVAVHDFGFDDGQHFFSMDYVEGRNLAQLVGQGPLPPARAARYGQLIAEAVHYAHEHEILHRDLKPSNVLIDAHDQPRITDFGLAKRVDGEGTLTMSGQVLGSPSYMPPEQARADKAMIGRHSDVYALGAVLYHLLTGRPPFQSATPAEVLRQVVECEPVALRLLNSSVPRDLETICLKCLEKDPQRRYATARELAHDLERWSAHQPILARRAGPIHRLHRWTRRNPVGAALIVSLFLGLAVSLGLLKLFQDERRAADAARNSMDRARTILWQQLGVSGFWEKSNAAVRIPAELLSLAAGVPAVAAPTTNVLGLLVEENPVEAVMGYAKLLAAVEKKLVSPGTEPLRLELMIFKRNQDAIDALLRREVDIVKLGGNSYLRAKQQEPNLQLLVSQNPPKNGIIFTHRNSGIARLEELKNRSFVFGDWYSTLSAWAQYYLTRAGVSLGDLEKHEFLDSIEAFETNAVMRAQIGTLSSHTLAIEAVRTNAYDAGVASESQFLRTGVPAGLVVLKKFPSSAVFWVTRAGFPAERAGDLQRALLDLRDPEIFKAISRRITHYRAATDAELDPLRDAMAVAGEHFGERNETDE